LISGKTGTKDNFSLAKDARLSKKMLSFEPIGLYQDEYRTELLAR
jgi:hypothetical protein